MKQAPLPAALYVLLDSVDRDRTGRKKIRADWAARSLSILGVPTSAKGPGFRVGDNIVAPTIVNNKDAVCIYSSELAHILYQYCFDSCPSHESANHEMRTAMKQFRRRVHHAALAALV